jgi:hypothetical protein
MESERATRKTAAGRAPGMRHQETMTEPSMDGQTGGELTNWSYDQRD